MMLRTGLSILGMLAVAATSIVCVDRLGLETGAFDHVRTAEMALPDTNGLVVGSKVLLRGVPIGYVTDISPYPDRVDVSWSYDRDYDIPVRSRYRVDNLSALGETYLSVLPATSSGPYLSDGATVDPALVVVPTTLQELSARLTRLLRQVEPDRIRDIFAVLNVALPEEVRVLGDLERAGQLLAHAVTAQSGNLTTLLRTMQPLLLDSAWLPGDLAGAGPNLAPFARGFSDMIDGMHFAVEFGPLRDGIKYGAGPFLDEVQAFLDLTADDLGIIGARLLPGTRAGAAALRGVDIGRFLDNALAATASGDAMTIHIRSPRR
ncbi:MlaD family protein [Nocardia bovistercoris]|uniref:MCE family protein n=1 Tax=Nocardia bovistercoris TaxID=2785916 RepID=A0A931N002_9NOCA|nr:MlaD family protein [Nocardia bovistercoris]MBH0776705.1 MCE family protein [Nocardia bovistercoris]